MSENRQQPSCPTAAHLLLPPPVWLPWATVAVSLVITYGYLARQMLRHRAAPAPIALSVG